MGFDCPLKSIYEENTRLAVQRSVSVHNCPTASASRLRTRHFTLSRRRSRKGSQHPAKRLRTSCSADLEARRDQLLGLPGDGHLDCAPTFVEAPGRVVAIGDVHGDLSKTFISLELAGVCKQINQRAVWCGGDTTVVQLGDVLDRGDQEIGCLLLLQDLHRQAQQYGGAVYMLNGNHESLNLIGNFRWATRGGMLEAAKATGLRGPALNNVLALAHARQKLYRPGGPIARMLARNPTALVVNDTLFAHGGVLPDHVDYGLERINREVSAWMRGETPTNPRDSAQVLAMGNMKSILWNRMFGSENFEDKGRTYVTRTLRTVLDRVGATDMVIGHTPQVRGANMECGGQLWRLDVGMSCGVLNAAPQVLEITRDARGRSVKRLLTAIPVSNGIPIGVPYCQIRW